MKLERLFQVVVLLFVAGWCFTSYHLVRKESGPLGTTFTEFLLDLLRSAICSIPLLVVFASPVGAMGLLDTYRFLQRFRGATPGEFRCLQCGYPAQGLRERSCPECGSSNFGTVHDRPRRRGFTILLAALIGWPVGSTFAEATIQIDEALFRHQAVRSGATFYTRKHWWPLSGGEMLYQNGAFWNVDD